MPIFTSRFSPERSLVGNFIASRTRGNEDAESRENTRRSNGATSRSSQQADTDRLEISNKQQSNFAATLRTSERTANTRTENNGADQQVVRQGSLRKASQEAVVARSNLQSLQQDTSVEAFATRSTQSALSTPQTQITQDNINAVQSALTSRIDVLVERLSEIRTAQSALANQSENVVAAQSAEPGPLASLAQATAESAQTPNGSIREEGATGQLADRLEARIDQLRGQRIELASSFTPPAPPEREEQQAELREGLQTIANGLQNDAAIENQRTTQQTERNSQVASQREQRQTIRENQNEIRNLQTARRQLDQEAQSTDQAIRQLQNETSRLKNSSTASGTALDLLAQ